MPARCSRPDNLTFSTPRPAKLTHPDREYFPPVGCRREPPGHTSYLLCLYLSNAASLDLPLDAGEVLPPRQSYYSVFTCPTQRVLISRWTPARCSRPDNLTFSVFTCPTQQVLISQPDNLTFPVFTCPTQRVLISRWTPARCSRPDNLTFSVFTCPTQRVLISRWTPARCSRPDKRSSVCSHQNIEPRRTRHTRPFRQS